MSEAEFMTVLSSQLRLDEERAAAQAETARER